MYILSPKEPSAIPLRHFYRFHKYLKICINNMMSELLQPDFQLNNIYLPLLACVLQIETLL